MGYIALKCPSCGAAVESTSNKEFFFCEYCGTKIVKDKQYIELSGSVTVNGIAGLDALLDRAFLFLEDRDFINADRYLEKALDLHPKCARAYIGKLMCSLRYTTIEQLKQHTEPLTRFEMYNKALRFATPDELPEIEGYNQPVKNLKKDIEEHRQLILRNEAFLKTNRGRFIAARLIRFLCICLIVVIVIFFFANTFGRENAEAASILIVDAVLAGIAVVSILAFKKLGKKVDEYISVRKATKMSKQYLQQKKQRFKTLQNRQHLP